MDWGERSARPTLCRRIDFRFFPGEGLGVAVLSNGQSANLFNQAALTNKYVGFNRNGDLSAKLSVTDFYKGGWDVNKLVNPVDGASPAKNINYGFPTGYQGIRDVRLGMRLQF